VDVELPAVMPPTKESAGISQHSVKEIAVMGGMPTVEELDLSRTEEPPEEEDTVRGALRFVGIGTGQCGGNLADAFYAEGFRGFGVVNSNPQDMAALKLPKKRKLCVGDVDGGAGQDMERGRQIIQARRDEVIEFIKETCGKRYHRLFLMNSTAGGTGAGSFQLMLECAERASQHLRKDKPVIGAILALPNTGEGYHAKSNTLKVLEFALKAVSDKRLSPLILVDNARMEHLASMLRFYPTINRYIAQQLVRFNHVALEGSGVAQFDGTDYLNLLDSGVVTFGVTRVEDVGNGRAIGKAIKEKFKKNILLETPLDKVTHAGCVLVGSTATLDGILQEQLEDGLKSLNDMIAAKSTMHRGIYVDENEKGLLVTTLLGGLGSPTAYLDALRNDVSSK
jgi:cell division GTPase FtsZ